MKPSSVIRTVTLAVALAVSAGGALAQPAMGHHRGGGDFAMAIAALKGQLNLNTSQQQQWDNAVAASKAARASSRANLQSLHDAAKAELAKPEPDLASLSALSDATQSKNVAARHQARDAWLALYASFTPDQKAVVRDALNRRMARMEQMREKFLQRHGAPG